MSDSFTTVVLHCAGTMPDSIAKRKELLVALGNLISAKHPAFDIVKAQLAAIHTMEKLQAELPLTFSSAPAKPSKNDGN